MGYGRNTPTHVGKRLSIYAAYRGFRCHLYEKLLQIFHTIIISNMVFSSFFVQEKETP